MWRQRSRVEWLVSKDLNTKFFHASTVIWWNINSIMTLQMEDNSWVIGRTPIGDSLIQYFTQLFDSTNPYLPFDLANLISPVIVQGDSLLLDSIPMPMKIYDMDKSMESNKAPRHNGLPVLFLQRILAYYWS